MIAQLAPEFRRDSRGSVLTEFAIITPAFFVMLMGVVDIAYRGYFNGVLQGAVNEAARNATLETSASASKGEELDEDVKELAGVLAANGTWSFDRKSYTSFTRAGAQEKFTDSDGDNVRDVGECYEDENSNSTWDADSGVSGQGGAKDITRYTVTVRIPRIFPLYGMLGWNSTQTVQATTVLRNQPYDSQAARPVVVRCT